MMHLTKIADLRTTEHVCEQWQSLKAFTAARIALGRTGTSVPLKESLAFKIAHAHARDAVYSCINKNVLQAALQPLQPLLFVRSRAKDRVTYLTRPDLGRLLDAASTSQLALYPQKNFDIAIVIADGLSAEAINLHTVPLLRVLLAPLSASGWSIAPLVVAEQARVAIADPIGDLLKARLTINLIGERPGLTCSHSLGAYFTFCPRPGLTDEARNCISNIHPAGLPYAQAGKKIFTLAKQILSHKLSGVLLKDDQQYIPE